MHSTTLPVVIVGGGGIEQELRLKAKELNLSNVHFVGALNDEDKTALLQLCYSVVFPSHLRSEAFGITLLEGAMFGKPLISCEIGTGTSYINIDKYTGIVVPPANTLKLREAMNELWDSPKLARLYGNNAYERFNKTFTSVEMSKQYFLLYKGLLSQNIL